MNSAEDVVPEKIRPLLFRRYEELKKRRETGRCHAERYHPLQEEPVEVR